ncbi:MAG: alpha-ketoglutarate-dependent dioxygenase AlkB [Candidatus Eremiobacteraeota bacterium]|nr:alpha-ketoglutarate-dependent dioxygenase AlkB [Candidatus Eremiobacteraeota bacterium]
MAHQLSFTLPLEFETLVDDELGTIVYKRGLFTPEQSAAWFQHLRDGVQWRNERRPMYDRIVDVPRLVASYGVDDADLPEPIRAMRPAVEQFCGVAFLSAGLNFYRDGNDSVAPHGDHVERAVDQSPVALVSLGATRRMTIRSVFTPRRILDRDLEPGSLLVMSYASHLNYLHGIPKTKTPVGERISVAFRRVPRDSMRMK